MQIQSVLILINPLLRWLFRSLFLKTGKLAKGACDIIITGLDKTTVFIYAIDVFLEFPLLLYEPIDVVNLISGSSAFSKSSLCIWKFSVHVLLKPSL